MFFYPFVSRLLPLRFMAANADAATPTTSHDYIPRAARAVPRDDVVHTIEFHKISYPLTNRPSELWITETNRRGHTQWRASHPGALTNDLKH